MGAHTHCVCVCACVQVGESATCLDNFISEIVIGTVFSMIANCFKLVAKQCGKSNWLNHWIRWIKIKLTQTQQTSGLFDVLLRIVYKNYYKILLSADFSHNNNIKISFITTEWRQWYLCARIKPKDHYLLLFVSNVIYMAVLSYLYI